jgi:D-alanyl-D-alanine dipeptidase
MRTGAAAPAPFDSTARYGPCTAPLAQRSPDNVVDMGTSFDCFDAASYTASATISAEQRRWRNVLLAAMRKQGFANYDHEWWHFSYAGSAGAPAYDFPIRAP